MCREAEWEIAGQAFRDSTSLTMTKRAAARAADPSGACAFHPGARGTIFLIIRHFRKNRRD